MQVRWETIVERAAASFGTPFYLVSEQAVTAAFHALRATAQRARIRHWLSLKTQPLPAIIQICRRLGVGIECVSEYEVRAALCEGVPPAQILVNGVAKHCWLQRFSDLPLNVVLDSVSETSGLVPCASAWRLGFRLNTPYEINPDAPSYGSQFGLTVDELAEAATIVARAGRTADIIHFHLYSNVPNVDTYLATVDYLLGAIREAELHPRVLDCGGGLPAPGERLDCVAVGDDPTFVDLLAALVSDPERSSRFDEIWFENGRAPLSSSAVLVVSVRDIKERADSRYLICDGGRTNHALVSDWERHRVSIVPARQGPALLTAVCGNTCMAYDMLARIDLPSDIRVGDKLIWHNAGAYHIPWETHFSSGLCRIVLQTQDGSLEQVRGTQGFEEWWCSLGG